MLFFAFMAVQAHAETEGTTWDSRGLPGNGSYSAWESARNNPRNYSVDIRFSFSAKTGNLITMVPSSNEEMNQFKGSNLAAKGHLVVLEHFEAPSEGEAVKMACDKYKLGMIYEKNIHYFDCPKNEKSWKDTSLMQGIYKVHCQESEPEQPKKIQGFLLRKGINANSPVICGFGTVPGAAKECDCELPATS